MISRIEKKGVSLTIIDFDQFLRDWGYFVKADTANAYTLDQFADGFISACHMDWYEVFVDNRKSKPVGLVSLLFQVIWDYTNSTKRKDVYILRYSGAYW